jgi:phospholipid transport system substrate-binding protein
VVSCINSSIFFREQQLPELSPDEVVKKTADDVISAIKSDKDIQAGNKKAIYALVESKILPSFDFNKICRLVMGKNWRKMSAGAKRGI